MEQDTPGMEPAVYEPPVLSEIGGFARETQGVGDDFAEGGGTYYHLW